MFHAHYMTWRSSMSGWELFCLSQAIYCKLLFGNENLKKYHSMFKQNDAKCKWESSQTFAQKCNEIWKEQLTKFGDFHLHYFCKILLSSDSQF